MKLRDFLNEAYANEENREKESAIRYALRYLSYIDEGNELLQTEDVLRYGEERKEHLTGEEILEEGIYLLWSMAHEGSEWLMRFETVEEAKEEKEKIENVKFSSADGCYLKVVI